jgi:hypothetical protein
MIVDCMTCPARGRRCEDCAVTVLRAPRQTGLLPAGPLPSPVHLGVPLGVPLDAAESRVVSMFVGAGLVGAGAAARLRARIEDTHGWGSVRDVG